MMLNWVRRVHRELLEYGTMQAHYCGGGWLADLILARLREYNEDTH